MLELDYTVSEDGFIRAVHSNKNCKLKRLAHIISYYLTNSIGCGCNDLADTLSEYCSYQSTEIKLPRLQIHIHYRVPLIADI